MPANGSDTEVVTISTKEVSASSEGAISLTVEPGDGYNVPSSATPNVKVLSIEQLPSVTIVRTSPATIREGEDAIFTISAAGTLAADLPITVSYQGGDDFISGTPTLTPSIASATNTHIYTINTVADTTDEANDTIAVTISTDPKKTSRTEDATYLVGSPATATITVEDDDAAAGSPVVTIAGDASEVYEGSDAVFTITNAGSSQVNVHYEIAQDGDFLTTTITDDDDDVPANDTVKVTLEN